MKASIVRWCMLSVMFVPAIPLSGQDRPILFEHARLFDGERSIEDTSVLIQKGRIVAVGPSDAPADAEHIDGRGKTLLPGLIDAHVHIHGALSLEEALVSGVTTELDMMSQPKMDQALHREENYTWADFQAAGILATVPGGHGTEYGFAIPTIERPQEAQAWVDARLAEGSDYIKLVYGDSRIFGGRMMPRPTLSRQTMAAIIAAAHARGKLAVVHINTEQDARDALNAGADGLAHLFFGAYAGKDFGTFVAAHHAFVVPTLSVLSGTCDNIPSGEALTKDPELTKFMTPGQKTRLKEGRREVNLSRGRFMASAPSCDGAQQAVKLLRDAGVPVLVGTDAPNLGTAHGISVHGEMELLVKAGLSPSTVLSGATAKAAAAFRIQDRGRISPGMRADLLLVDGDPTQDIRATRKIVGVWKAGVPVQRKLPQGPGDDGD